MRHRRLYGTGAASGGEKTSDGTRDELPPGLPENTRVHGRAGGVVAVAERWIVIARWDEFQHRDAARAIVPTWVKTFTRLLSDDDYLSLTGHRRAVLHGIWLEYARSLRLLPDDTAVLSRRLSLKVTRPDLEALNHAGFIDFHASRPASNPASTPAGIEERREVHLRAVQRPLQDPPAREPEPEPGLDDEPTLTDETAPGSHPRNLIEQSLHNAGGHP
jgi:hypothetical protein